MKKLEYLFLKNEFIVFLLVLTGALFFNPDFFLGRFKTAPYLFFSISFTILSLFSFSIKRKKIKTPNLKILFLWIICLIYHIIFSHFELKILSFSIVSIILYFYIENSLREEKDLKNIIHSLFFLSFILLIHLYLQYFSLIDSDSDTFKISNPFDNPAGCSALLSGLFPFSIYLYKESRHKIILLFFIVTYAFMIFILDSRAGVLSIISSSIFLFCKKKHIKNKKILLFTILTFILIFFALYFHKSDSANGRMLIWEISSNIIKDNFFFGSGYNGFSKNYMNYQANYFAHNQGGGGVEFLADNINSPFNELLWEFIHWGTLGGILVLSILILAVIGYFKETDISTKKYILASLLGICVFSLFSYPFSYPIISIIFLVEVFILLNYFPNNYKPNNKTFIFLGLLCVLSLFISSKMLYYEYQLGITSYDENLISYEELSRNSYFKNNPSFLYNYGLALNETKNYEKSIEILDQCSQLLNDYELQMLQGYNYQAMGDFKKSNDFFKKASLMIPNRFVPLYELMMNYKSLGDNYNSMKTALIIRNKKVKVSSQEVEYIRKKAENLIKSFYYKN